jgi:PAS domain S-box-containing protein
VISELLDLIPDPVIGCDAEGIVVYWSRAAAEIYGYASGEAIGQPVITLLQTRFPLPLLEIIEEVTDVGRWQGNLVHRAKDGGEHTVESRWVARYDDQHRLVGGFGIERKLSDLDTVKPDRAVPAADREQPARVVPAADPEPPERALRQVERLESLSQLAGGVAHDFNNALAIITNYAAFIAGELETAHRESGDLRTAAMRQDLAEIQTAAEQAAALTQKLLAISRQAAGTPAAVDLNHQTGQ